MLVHIYAVNIAVFKRKSIARDILVKRIEVFAYFADFVSCYEVFSRLDKNSGSVVEENRQHYSQKQNEYGSDYGYADYYLCLFGNVETFLFFFGLFAVQSSFSIGIFRFFVFFRRRLLGRVVGVFSCFLSRLVKSQKTFFLRLAERFVDFDGLVFFIERLVINQLVVVIKICHNFTPLRIFCSKFLRLYRNYRFLLRFFRCKFVRR